MPSCRTTRTGLLRPVSLIARSFNIVVVNPASSIKSIAELIAAARQSPTSSPTAPTAPARQRISRANCSSTWPRSNLTTVPYKGAAPAITDLIGGQIQVMFTTVASALRWSRPVSLRAIAVTSAERSAAFPQLPTVSEAGVPGYAAEAWYGLYAPAQDAARYHRSPEQVRSESAAV